MKLHLFKLICEILALGMLGGSLAVPAIAWSNGEKRDLIDRTSLVMQANSFQALERIMIDAEKSTLKAKACSFQRAHRLAPSFCFFPNTSKVEREQLSARCVATVRRARVIPGYDDLTEPRCREAILERQKDLQYSSDE